MNTSNHSMSRAQSEIENIRRQLEALETVMPLNFPTSSRRVQADKTTYAMYADEQELDTEDSVDLAMRLMDSRYRTQFYSWIKDEKNVDAIAHHFKRFIFESEVKDIARGLRWLFQKWSMNSISTLLIKLFYEQGLTSPRFAEVVHLLCLDRPWSYVLDLLSTLMIGEDAQTSAGFIQLVTRTWSDELTVELVHCLAANARWSTAFYEEFIQQFATKGLAFAQSEMMLESIRKAFENRTVTSFVTPSEFVQDLSHRQLAKRIMSLVVQVRSQRSPADEKAVSGVTSNKATLRGGHVTTSDSDIPESLMSPTKEFN